MPIVVDDDDDESMSYVRPLLQLCHERANDTLWWTVQFSDHDGTRMEGGSCVAIQEQSL